MKNVLLFIWQLPQNLLALLLIPIYGRIFGIKEMSEYKGRKYVWFYEWRCGVSLGNYVLLGDYAQERGDIINHEYGHTCQSRIYGWFYLLLIGLPSGLWNRIDCLLSRTCKAWTYEKSYRIYYSMPWEHGADKRGGVIRHFD